MLKKCVVFLSVTALLGVLIRTNVNFVTVFVWGNGDFSDDPSNPKYGTHNWISEHALDWLPSEEKRYIVDNIASYLCGTELPDNNQAPDHIGDTVRHHVYYFANCSDSRGCLSSQGTTGI